MWELQRDMHELVAPSIWKAALEQGDPYERWLAERYADQRWDGEDGDYDALVGQALGTIERTNPMVIVEAIAEHAIELGQTTNGGHELYLDDWTTVPWCSDAEREDWFS